LLDDFEMELPGGEGVFVANLLVDSEAELPEDDIGGPFSPP